MGGRSRTRTYDPLIKSQLLYHPTEQNAALAAFIKRQKRRFIATTDQDRMDGDVPHFGGRVPSCAEHSRVALGLSHHAGGSRSVGRDGGEDARSSIGPSQLRISADQQRRHLALAVVTEVSNADAFSRSERSPLRGSACQPFRFAENIGGRSRTRTYDPLIKSQLLYHLSYAPADGPKAHREAGVLAKPLGRVHQMAAQAQKGPPKR